MSLLRGGGTWSWNDKIGDDIMDQKLVLLTSQTPKHYVCTKSNLLPGKMGPQEGGRAAMTELASSRQRYLDGMVGY